MIRVENGMYSGNVWSSCVPFTSLEYGTGSASVDIVKMWLEGVGRSHCDEEPCLGQRRPACHNLQEKQALATDCRNEDSSWAEGGVGDTLQHAWDSLGSGWSSSSAGLAGHVRGRRRYPLAGSYWEGSLVILPWWMACLVVACTNNQGHRRTETEATVEEASTFPGGEVVKGQYSQGPASEGSKSLVPNTDWAVSTAYSGSAVGARRFGGRN